MIGHNMHIYNLPTTMFASFLMNSGGIWLSFLQVYERYARGCRTKYKTREQCWLISLIMTFYAAALLNEAEPGKT